jgi:hypothetical protein
MVRLLCQDGHAVIVMIEDMLGARDFVVLDRRLELIMLYVRWAAFQELATTESSNPDPTSLALSTLELNAYRAQRLYLQSLQKAEEAESKSVKVEWIIDKWDSTY